jgi:hypothetical protein
MQEHQTCGELDKVRSLLFFLNWGPVTTESIIHGQNLKAGYQRHHQSVAVQCSYMCCKQTLEAG